MHSQPKAESKGFFSCRKYSDSEKREFMVNKFMETESEQPKQFNMNEQMDFNRLLPKSLMNDLNNLMLDGEGNTTGTTDLQESFNEEADSIDMNQRYSSSNETVSGNPQIFSAYKYNKSDSNESINFNKLTQANRNKYYSSGDVSMNAFKRRESDGSINLAPQNNPNMRFSNNYIHSQIQFQSQNIPNSQQSLNYKYQPMKNSNSPNFNIQRTQGNFNGYCGSENGMERNPYSSQNLQGFNQQTFRNCYPNNNNQNLMLNQNFGSNNRNYQIQNNRMSTNIENSSFKRMNSCEDVAQSSFISMKMLNTPSHSSSALNKTPCKLSSKNQITEREDFDTLDDLMASIQSDLSSFVKTQKGSRTLQKILDRIPPEKLDIVLECLKGDFSFLMTDTYGNYLCQKVIQCCSAEQRVYILRHILSEFTDIACNPSGTHSLQSLIEIINMKEEEELVKECVKDHVIQLAVNCNGTHVMQKIVSCLNENERQHINGLIMTNFYRLVFDSNGICVLKKFINGNESPEIRRTVVEKLQQNALEIIQNPFGNYIVQHVFDEWGVESCKDILKVIVNNVLSLSMQKFSSNVVERCLDIADEDSRMKIVKELFNASKISSLIKNKYGNYVLQKVISILNPEKKREIKEDLLKKVNVTSNKEKVRLKTLIDCL